jgi:hypothetical protein
MTRIAIALLAVSVSCAQVKDEGKQLAHDVIDCTTANAHTLTDQFAPVVDSLLRHATGGDGSIDWAPVRAATKSFAQAAGGCVLATVIARLMRPRPAADPSAPLAAPLEVDQAALLAGFGDLRRELFPGKRFLTDLGEL